MLAELQRLQDLQLLDTRLGGLRKKCDEIPQRIQAIREGVQQARAALDGLRARLETTRRDRRAREKDLDYQASQRKKCEARLYEVKTNKEYAAVLAEIEALKGAQARLEEEILALMEAEERLVREVGETEARLRRQEAEAQAQEAAATEELRALEEDLAQASQEREALAATLPRDLLDQYMRLLRARGGVAVALVGQSGICSACRVALTPQRFQEVRQSNQVLTCESCGRILYYQP